MVGDIAISLIPGEIFPELVSGLFYGDANYGVTNPPQPSEVAVKALD